MDRDARRRRPERSGRYSRPVADRPGQPGDAATADRRASRAPPGQLVEAAGLAHRQCGAPPAAARRHPGYRLRAQAVPARPLSRPALFRPHAPLSAGAGAARGRDRALGAGQPSPAPARHLEIRRLRPARGRHRRSLRRPLAAPAPRPAAAGRGCGAARGKRGGSPARPRSRRARPAPNRCGDDRQDPCRAPRRRCAARRRHRRGVALARPVRPARLDRADRRQPDGAAGLSCRAHRRKPVFRAADAAGARRRARLRHVVGHPLGGARQPRRGGRRVSHRALHPFRVRRSRRSGAGWRRSSSAPSTAAGAWSPWCGWCRSSRTA